MGSSGRPKKQKGRERKGREGKAGTGCSETTGCTPSVYSCMYVPTTAHEKVLSGRVCSAGLFSTWFVTFLW